MLIVSIHDVSPAQANDVRAAWDLCVRLDIVPALLVVPDWHGQWPLECHGGFVAWLRERAEDGAEILLHGERHDEVGLPRRFGDSVRAWGRTLREGEFLTLDAASACERIGRGLRRLQALGFRPCGFVAPAWLARDVAYSAAAAWGLKVAEDISTIHLLSRGLRLAAPVIRWSARTALRVHVSSLVATLRCILQRHAAVVRAAIHPPDMRSPRVTASVVRTLRSLRQHRRLARYCDLVAANEASLSPRSQPESPGVFGPGVSRAHGAATPTWP
jgi:predicted deacetylase